MAKLYDTRNSSRNSFSKNWIYLQRIYTYYVFFTHNLLLVLVLYSRMAFLQESALKEALKSFSMLPKAWTICCTRDWMFCVGWFCAGSRTIGRRSWADSLLAGSNKLVLYLSWQSPVHIGWTENGIFSNLTVNFQGTCDDGIQLNMTLIWKDRLEVNWQGLLLSRLENSPDLFKHISC